MALTASTPELLAIALQDATKENLLVALTTAGIKKLFEKEKS